MEKRLMTLVVVLGVTASTPGVAADGIEGDTFVKSDVMDTKVIQFDAAGGALKAGALSLGGPTQVVVGGVAVDRGRIRGNTTVVTSVDRTTVMATGSQVVVGGVGVRGQ